MNLDQIKPIIWETVKAVCAVFFIIVFTYKFIINSVFLNIDFQNLLSLLLAFFSVGLSVLFYFKATETSNKFYDNTYKYTKDIAELLVKIESGFGERLKNLDEGYASMRSYMQGAPSRENINGDLDEIKQKFESEKQDLKKMISERDDLVNKLANDSNLVKEEKENLLKEYNIKEKELADSRKEMDKLSKRILLERMNKRKIRNNNDTEFRLESFTANNVIKKLGFEDISSASASGIRRSFDKFVNELPSEYLGDMRECGYYDDNGLTLSGVHFIWNAVSGQRIS